jgi:hypothetical protein
MFWETICCMINGSRVILYLCVILHKYAGVVNIHFHFILFQTICKYLHYIWSYNSSETSCHYCMGWKFGSFTDWTACEEVDLDGLTTSMPKFSFPSSLNSLDSTMRINVSSLKEKVQEWPCICILVKGLMIYGHVSVQENRDTCLWLYKQSHILFTLLQVPRMSKQTHKNWVTLQVLIASRLWLHFWCSEYM